MFKKFLFAAIAAALTTAPAFATQYGTQYVSNIGMLVPVACNFLMPAESFGAISYGLGVDIDADQVISGGTCDVNWTPEWKDAGTGADVTSGNSLNGALVPSPAGPPNLPYTIYFSTGGLAPGTPNPANTIVGGTIHFHLAAADGGKAQGAHTYADVLTLIVNY